MPQNIGGDYMEQLRELRSKRKLTQLQVAQFLGVDRTTYVKYEGGNSDPPTATLVRLADYFGVTVDYLIGHDAVQKNVSDASNHIKLFEDERRLIESYRKLSNHGKEYISVQMEFACERYAKKPFPTSTDSNVG